MWLEGLRYIDEACNGRKGNIAGSEALRIPAFQETGS
jgi:hypothetical protein